MEPRLLTLSHSFRDATGTYHRAGERATLLAEYHDSVGRTLYKVDIGGHIIVCLVSDIGEA